MLVNVNGKGCYICNVRWQKLQKNFSVNFNNFNYSDLFHWMFLFCLVIVVRWWQGPVLQDFFNLMSSGSGDQSSCMSGCCWASELQTSGSCQAAEITVRSDAAAHRRLPIQSKNDFPGGKVKHGGALNKKKNVRHKRSFSLHIYHRIHENSTVL